ncbi:14036_t:CDS:2 [Acaulospora morrowiae]|uniref:14036_t:CDS:1 n=1 Tax=Acaulospora morrowiae TaxID=94023 RepID=A0A9N8V776_9GLOM|nr:14036_t:CDS:2 [Acaulospora morrowiae]
MHNPWRYLNADIRCVFTNLYDVIFNFVIRNSILAIRFDVVPNPETPRKEVDLLYWRNWICVSAQFTRFVFTLPVVVLYPLMMLKSLESEFVRRPIPSTRNKYPDEKWFFINGIAGEKEWLEQNCRYLEDRFQTEVTGIFNKSYGLLWDLVESILQRSFEILTISVRLATINILPALRDKNIKTVRLIAHSQGSIITSVLIKKLYLELSYTNQQDYLGKLEIYTFSNGSREFKNPGGLIRYIEHYANSKDPVAKLGVLNPALAKNFQGNIFVNQRSGHLFNTYYSLHSSSYAPYGSSDV